MGWTFTESSPAHRSSPFGLDWTQTFDRNVSGLGLDEQLVDWAGRTDDDGVDWAGPNFANGPGLSAYSRTRKMRAKRSNMSYFTPNFLRFDNLHQFCPLLKITQEKENVKTYLQSGSTSASVAVHGYHTVTVCEAFFVYGRTDSREEILLDK